MNANNTYFENLKRIGHEYEERRAAHEGRKQRIIDTYGWDSEELKNVVKQEKITHILFEEGSEFEQQQCVEDMIAATYEKVYETEDGRIRIYKTSE